MRCIYARNGTPFLAMKCVPTDKCGWQRLFCVALAGLGFFTVDLPRAALADSLCPGLSYFALAGRRKRFVSYPAKLPVVK